MREEHLDRLEARIALLPLLPVPELCLGRALGTRVEQMPHAPKSTQVEHGDELSDHREDHVDGEESLVPLRTVEGTRVG